MKIFNTLSIATFLLFVSVVPAFAGVTISSPYDKSTVSSPFTLSASASACSNQSIATMGYSLDSSPDTTIFKGSAINASISVAAGGHTVHVKSWGNGGASCVSDVTVIVSSTSSNSSGPSISAPTNGASVGAPFNLLASHANCNGQPVNTIGYSLDTSSSTSTVAGTILNTLVSTGAGGHTVHVKSWGNGGATCKTDLAVSVNSSGTPTNANNVSSIQALGWSSTHDAGTPGTSSGWSGTTGAPSRSGNARHFATSFSNYGGQRFSVSIGDNKAAHNFVYDAWLYIQNSTQGIANIEMDINQVISNGYTVIMGFQCSYWSGTWDYTVNAGSATHPVDKWIRSGAQCNPKKWAVNTWHHVQIGYSRTDDGHVTYQYAALDGVKQTINATVFSGFALGWAPTIVTNFQIGGDTSGSGGSNVFLDNATISEW